MAATRTGPRHHRHSQLARRKVTVAPRATDQRLVGPDEPDWTPTRRGRQDPNLTTEQRRIIDLRPGVTDGDRSEEDANRQTMEKTALLDTLKAADDKTNDQWLSSLNERKRAELEFHDADRDESLLASMSKEEYERTHGNKKYYTTTEASSTYIHNWIRDRSRGRIVLDYAAGNGELALQAAVSEADLVVGLDISRVSIANCRRTAATRGLTDNTFFLQGDCENTGLPDNAFDTVICSGMLHHLDLSYAFPELRRIMKPGGRCLCIEALNYNPLIKLYRKLTPAMRTEWEKAHILSMADVRFASRFFDITELRYWHLLSIAAAPLRKTALFPAAMAVGNAIDSAILRIPLLRQMAWMFSFVLVKQEDR